jgi:hypothetical protein
MQGTQNATRPAKTAPASDAAANRGEQYQKTPSVTIIPIEPQDTLSVSTPAEDAPPTSVPTGDTVNTGGDNDLIDTNETGPADSTQVKH